MSGAPLIFDPALRRDRLRRALRAAEPGAGFLVERAADELGDRLGAVLRRFSVAVDLGTPTPHAAAALRAAGVSGALVRAVPTAEAVGAGPWSGVVLDDETPAFAPESLDLVVSVLALQTVNDLPGAFAQIRRSLKPDGLFLACLAGGATLTELRQAFAQAESEVEGGVSPRVAPFADVRDMGALLQRAGFALPVTDVDAFTVRYADPLALLRDLRAMGATNVLVERRRTPLRRDTLLRMMQIYAERFSDPDGRVRATFELLWVSGWAPHESQQKPLRPGSAKARLADALGVPERPAGEKPGPGQ
ncbi:methyltransferase domain-containing protein [Alsobacter sp. SYSU M60028]|uniref:Methyltransferase domain-containing protein n=1 Tax=Alsobacter ponti TaxID=2962936 RepID=A0ABT1LBQ3_9HYPH|nr:methyltransferase domain-containing protein [Alsobacter ponti]MCP8938917.1 methyltransferase domain-containing protein [Alsobacter ponti]